MKARILILLAVSALFLVAGIVIYFLLAPDTEPAPQGAAPTFPSGDGNAMGGGTTVTEGKISIPNAKGEPVVVNDFINNGETVEDSQDPGHYYLAGSLGYCRADGTCPSGARTDTFTIVYNKEYGLFTIGLDKEPLGQSRVEAEAFLMERLGISAMQLCAISHTVNTTAYVNQAYAGQELDFSFCSGAVKLP